ncbi:MAG: tryptophan synthase subunit alpha, partial [Anaerolineales bacterium]|nr:tryptophan synthase subunit alpha [Anaerolineales bacterium]
PFSDPLADGPIIQQATQTALEQGMTLHGCLGMAGVLRELGITIPFILMGYINPILAYGQERFCRACTGVGIDGLIVPDLPPEEGETLENACRQYGLALIYLLAPTSKPERIQLVAERAEGFIYLVAVKGVTGPRKEISPDLSAFIERVRAVTTKPLAVGFGISNGRQARQAAGLADGVIVGSALVKLAGELDGRSKVAAFVRELGDAVRS